MKFPVFVLVTINISTWTNGGFAPSIKGHCISWSKRTYKNLTTSFTKKFLIFRLHCPVRPHVRIAGPSKVLADCVGGWVLSQSPHRSPRPEGGKPAARRRHEHQNRRLWLLQLFQPDGPFGDMVRLSALRRTRGIWGEDVYWSWDWCLGKILEFSLAKLYYNCIAVRHVKQ